MRTTIALVFLILMVPPAAARQLEGPVLWADSARRAIETAYVEGDVDALVAARAIAERALARWPEDPLLLHYTGYAYYREATLRQGAGGTDNVDALLDAAQESLEASAERHTLAETTALLSAVLGQKIGSNMIRGMTLGPRSGSLMDEAVRLGPENPRVWLMRGISAIFTPGMFGGGLDKAEDYLRQAIALFERDDPQPPAPAWGNGEAWLWLGQVFERRKDDVEALRAYRTALEIEPENQWLKEVLVPATERRIRENRE